MQWVCCTWKRRDFTQSWSNVKELFGYTPKPLLSTKDEPFMGSTALKDEDYGSLGKPIIMDQGEAFSSVPSMETKQSTVVLTNKAGRGSRGMGRRREEESDEDVEQGFAAEELDKMRRQTVAIIRFQALVRGFLTRRRLRTKLTHQVNHLNSIVNNEKELMMALGEDSGVQDVKDFGLLEEIVALTDGLDQNVTLRAKKVQTSPYYLKFSRDSPASLMLYNVHKRDNIPVVSRVPLLKIDNGVRKSRQITFTLNGDLSSELSAGPLLNVTQFSLEFETDTAADTFETTLKEVLALVK